MIATIKLTKVIIMLSLDISLGRRGTVVFEKDSNVLHKERVGVEMLQPAQEHYVQKEGMTETSVGGRDEGRRRRGEGGDGLSHAGWLGIYTDGIASYFATTTRSAISEQ